jgi:IS30 family transposase
MRFYSHLSDHERDQIAILRSAGGRLGAVARALGRAKTIISRELQRNALPLGSVTLAYLRSSMLERRREVVDRWF